MSRKIRILYTIPNFDTAGSGRVLYNLAKGLDKTKFDVIIACKHNKGDFFKEIEALGLSIHFMDSTVSLRPYITLFSRIKPFKLFLEEHLIDIVHSWHWSSDWSEVLATKRARVKFIYTKKAMSWGNIHWKIRSFLSSFIVTVNTEMNTFFPYKKQQQLIPFGLDISHYNSNLFTKEKHKQFKIVTVANLVAVKEIETLIKAVNETNKSDIVLEIIGDEKDTYANQLKQLVNDLSMNNRITFLGKQNDVRSFLAQADLFVIPSKKEGMPMALVEAMAMSLPVLGSNIPGINYVLKTFENLLFEKGNYHVLSEKIIEMYHKSPEDRLTLGKELRNYCETHFSLSTFISAHETLYFKLARK